MSELQVNKDFWGNSYSWPAQGDEWSVPWGGEDMQWYCTLLPRLHPYLEILNAKGNLSVETLLEIAPGYGRWTKYLKNFCDELIIVDLAESCIEACKTRFQTEQNFQYFVNDGKSLEMIKDESIELIFSFDSLVHAEVDVIEAYLLEFSKKLTLNGVVFIHHSNLASSKRTVKNHHWRASSVSYKLVQDLAHRSGLRCLSQEIFAWGGSQFPIDCISVLVRQDSHWQTEYQFLENTKFEAEIAIAQQQSQLYRRARFLNY